MKLLTCIAVLLSTSCVSKAVSAVDQHTIYEQSFLEQDYNRQRLSDVVASSPLLSLHRAICEIESVTTNELAVAKLLISTLEAHNFTVRTQTIPQPAGNNSTKERLNIYAYPDTTRYGSTLDTTKHDTKPKVVLSSHMDTVPPHIPYALSLPKHKEPSSTSKSWRKDILISGRGTVDDKACVAAQLQATLDLLSTNSISPEDVALLFVVGEEKDGIGMRTFSNSSLYASTKENLKAVLFGEPTEGKLAAGHKGILLMTIKAYGKAAHSGYPWLGRSANSMILPALNVIDGLGDLPENKGGLPRSKKYGKSTVNVGCMQGGVAGNVVPEFAMAEIAVRLAGGTPAEVKELITKAVRSIDPDELLELNFTQGYGPVGLDVDVKGFDTITVNYGTDVPNLKLDEGVKRYLYGPGSILVAHGKNEALTVGDLEESLEGYKKLVKHALET